MDRWPIDIKRRGSYYILMIPKLVQEILDEQGITSLRPSQQKSIDAGLFEGKNLLVCTPTASGKTLVAEMAILNSLQTDDKQGRVNRPMCIYVVPLRALASEKYKDFSKKYPQYKIALTSGDMDNDDRYLEAYDIIITTSEKLDSLIRHHTPWMPRVEVVVIDEIHLLNDISRGPTLEILITMLRTQLKKLQLIALSATIGNASELAEWLGAELIEDSWRPVRLDKGVLHKNKIYFDE